MTPKEFVLLQGRITALETALVELICALAAEANGPRLLAAVDAAVIAEAKRREAAAPGAATVAATVAESDAAEALFALASLIQGTWMHRQQDG